MKSIAAATAVCLAAMVSMGISMGLSTAVFAQAGTGVSGVSVGLEQDPDGAPVPAVVTDRDGNATFAGVKTGRYVVVFADTSKLKKPLRVTISGPDGKKVVSQPVMIGKASVKTYALHPDGVKLSAEVPKGTATGRITVRVENAR